MADRSESPLAAVLMLGLVVLVAVGATLLGQSRHAAREDALLGGEVQCELRGREPTESVTVGPGVVGLMLQCDRPVEIADVAMTLDGEPVDVTTYPGEGERYWSIVADTLLTTQADHTARVEVEAGGRSLVEEWSFTFTPSILVPPGPDSPPAIAVMVRADGSIETYTFDHVPDTCGEVLSTFFCAEHREIPFTPIRYEELDLFVPAIPADATIRPRDPSCFTALRPTPAAPEAPRGLELEPMPVEGGTGVTLQWEDLADDEDCYVLERATWGQYPEQIQVLATLPAGSTSFVDPRPYGAPGGVAYRVYAATEDARSAYSETVAYAFDEPASAPSPVCYARGVPGGEGAPAPPSGLEAKLVPPVSRSGWGVDLAWEDNADGEACYVLETEIKGPVEATIDTTVEPRTFPANTTEGGVSYSLTRTSFEVTYRVYAATENARSEAVEITVEIPGMPPQ